MKSVTQEYIDQEESTKQQPIELYHIWRDGGQHWYYTSADQIVNYNGNDYQPATLKRELAKYDSQLEVTTMTIQAASVTDPVIEFVSLNPIEILWIEIRRGFRDLSEAVVIFVGQIKNVKFKGASASIQCVGFEHFLKMPIPTLRYQTTCNWRLFDSHCKKNKVDYKVTATVTVDETKTELTSSTFGNYSDNYFTSGLLEFGDGRRTITYHRGSTIKVAYRIPDIVDNDSVDIYPGCDGRAETCREKYNNINNFLGFPFIPMDNPAMRISS